MVPIGLGIILYPDEKSYHTVCRSYLHTGVKASWALVTEELTSKGRASLAVTTATLFGFGPSAYEDSTRNQCMSG